MEAIRPLCPPAAPAGPVAWRDHGQPLRVIARIDHPDLDTAHAQAKADLAGGVGGLVLVGAGAATAHGFGLPLLDAASFAAVLDGIEPAHVALRLEASGDDAGRAGEGLLRWAEGRAIAPGRWELDIGLDPIAAPAEWAVRLAERAHAMEPCIAILRADGRPHHAAGAMEAQELAAVLSAGVAGLRLMEPLGLERARGALSFALAADTDLAMTIAKCRALRRLWASIEHHCGLPSRPLRLHAETGWRSLARDDPHTNLLRQGMAAAAAILGGADSLTVLPFTAALGLADDHARRLARNTATILIAEAGLGRVADPAGGAGALEALTDALCWEGWRLFQIMEAGGGLAAALRDGSWATALAESAAARQDDLASGRATLVGVTAYRPAAADSPAVLAQRPPTSPSPAARLPTIRDASAFEAAP